jgi:hypothetical protein
VPGTLNFGQHHCGPERGQVVVPDVVITSVSFKKYKAFDDYSVSLDKMNILVGPNNSGKSTIIGAFRILASALIGARARNPVLVPGPEGDRFGYRISEEALPVSVENVHTNYERSDATVSFSLSDGNHLHLFFPEDGGSFLIPGPAGPQIRSTSDFRRAFPIDVAVVPVLGPVDYREQLIETWT